MCGVVPGRGQVPNNHLSKEFRGADRQQQAGDASLGKRTFFYFWKEFLLLAGAHDNKRNKDPGVGGSWHLLSV